MGIEIALGVAGLVVGVAGAATSAIQQDQAADAAERDAKDAAQKLLERGKVESDLRRREGRRLLARQRALAGASNLGQESFFDLLADTAITEERAAGRVFDRFALEAKSVLGGGRATASGLRQSAVQTLIGGTASFATGAASLGFQSAQIDAFASAGMGGASIPPASRFGAGSQRFGGMLGP